MFAFNTNTPSYCLGSWLHVSNLNHFIHYKLEALDFKCFYMCTSSVLPSPLINSVGSGDRQGSCCHKYIAPFRKTLKTLKTLHGTETAGGPREHSVDHRRLSSDLRLIEPWRVLELGP